MAVSDLVNLPGLIDDAKCFAFVRQHRWPGNMCCPGCGSGAIVLAKPEVCAGTGATTCSPAGSAIKACACRFDDLTGLDAASRHLRERVSRTAAGQAPSRR